MTIKYVVFKRVKQTVCRIMCKICKVIFIRYKDLYLPGH